VLALALALLLGGCASEDALYRWGSYEDIVRETMLDASAARVADGIRRLSAEIAQARAEGRRVGPGMHAQLGYLEYLSGDREAAVLELTAERELYPESGVFIEGLLRRMKAKGAP
jgi:hypothetical protein